MRRSTTCGVKVVVLAMLVVGCTNVISLSRFNYPPRPPDAPVELIDVRNMERPAVQRVLTEYDVLARFHALTRQGDRYEESVAEIVENAKADVRERGGHALLYTHDSETIAAIYQDVKYAGPSDALVMYILRRKDES